MSTGSHKTRPPSSGSRSSGSGSQPKSRGERQPLRYVPPHLRRDRSQRDQADSKDTAQAQDGKRQETGATSRQAVVGVRHFGRREKVDQGRFTVCRYVLLAIMMFFAIFSLSVGLYTRFSTYGPKSEEMAPNNTYLLSPMSTHFCRGVEAKSTSTYNLLLQTFPGKPPLSDTDHWIVKKQKMRLGVGGLFQLDYVLNEGSKVKIETCSIKGVVFYVFKSIRQHQLWEKGDYDSFDYKHLYQGNCSLHTPYVITVEKSDTFILMWENSSPTGETLVDSIQLDVTRKKFDLNSTVLECQVQPNCQLDIPYASSQLIGVTIGWHEGGNVDDEVFFTWHCLPRNWLYVAVFFSLSVVALLLVPLSWFALCRGNARPCFAKRDSEEGTQLLERDDVRPSINTIHNTTEG